jgi:hypothetical protein
MNCPNCGASNRDTSKFCSRCGTPLPGVGAPAGAKPGQAPASPPPVSVQPSRPAPTPAPASLQPSRPAPAPGVPHQDRQPQPQPTPPPRHATQTISFDRLKHKNLVIAILAGGIFIIILGAIFVAWLIFRPGESDRERALSLEPAGEGLYLVSGNELKRMEMIETRAELEDVQTFQQVKNDQPVFVIQMDNIDDQTFVLTQFGDETKDVALESEPGEADNTLALYTKEALEKGTYCISRYDALGRWRAFWCFTIP